MNFTESFDQFSSKLSTMDLALYAGVGLVIWVLFKDRLSPVQKIVLDLVNSVKKPSSVVPVNVPAVDPVVLPKGQASDKDDVFFKLVVSWRQTRDLALKSGCVKAVEVADQMFPYLSPEVCAKSAQNNTKE